MNTTTTVETRLLALERQSRRWRFATLALGGVLALGLTLGFTQNKSNTQQTTSDVSLTRAIAVDSGGWAAVDVGNGQWRVIYRAGAGAFRMTAPGN